ncbi:MAG TPA: Na+/H+ antiporter [Candidatus Bathyarchaeia archaeon]|jgi:CPA1 family monovalent cation:H+ antiporter|nr:Na+/H+ antiporter [Candidatus Bathyarchaeia archaeon]
MTASSTIEFLMWLLIAASIIALIAIRSRVPYMVALVLGGLLLGTVRLPIVETIYQVQRPEWLTPDVILIFFLPALLFEGSLKINLRQLIENLVTILILATVGVVVATLVTGYLVCWLVGLPLLTALLFGALISATDPIAVLAIAKEMAVSKRLTLILEGESLFNDGTAVVLFQILLAAVVTKNLSLTTGVGHFLQSVLGGAMIGVVLGYLAGKITTRIDEPQIEITLTTIVAYGSYLLAHHFHVSGVIATVVAGLIVGNLGTRGMSPRTRVALWSFWEYASFVINSILFLLMGMKVRVADLIHEWHTVALAVCAMLLGRVLAVYGLTGLTNLFSQKINLLWQHVLVWGGLHGALSLALALSLSPAFEHRERVLTFTFGVVAFSMVVQGLSIKPLIRILGISTTKEDEGDRIRAQQIAVSSARSELDEMLKAHLLSAPGYEKLRREFDERLLTLSEQISEIYSKDSGRVESEMQTAKTRLLAAGKSAIEEAVRDGLISPQTGAKTADAIDSQLDELIAKLLKASG